MRRERDPQEESRAWGLAEGDTLDLLAAIVLPCLDEEAELRQTCESLGFGAPTTIQPPDTYLFIVDNGSTDATLEVARRVQRQAVPGTVFIGQELERGYVPPRHTGNRLVQAFAESGGLDPSEILILQADADTQYTLGYVEAMRTASRVAGPGAFLSGLAEFPPDFRDQFPEYVAMCSEVDGRVLSRLHPPEPSDLIRTDALCGYRLEDYLAWGGHRLEYREDGEEIHAETTRLFLRSVGQGSALVSVESALAYPSQRKVVRHPAADLASAGFPREAAWRASWERLYEGPADLDRFRTTRNDPGVLHAIRVRERHLVALFGVLPVHVARAIGGELPPPGSPLLEIALSLPPRDAETLVEGPGLFLTDVLSLVDEHGPWLDALLGGSSR